MTEPVSNYVLGLSPAGFHRLHYVSWGKEDAPRTIVCVHGMTRNSRDFDFLAQAIVASLPARVIAMDVVGRGDSDWLSDGALYTYPQYLADANTLLARLDCRQVDWIGTSMGARIGMILAAQPNHPLRSLFMNDLGPAIPRPALERLASYVGRSGTFETFEALLDYTKKIHAPYGPLTEKEWQHLAKVNARQDRDGSWRLAYDPKININLEAALKLPAPDLWPLWDKVQIPSMLYWGEKSDILLPEDAARMGQKAKLVGWPGIGHAPSLLDEKQIAPIIDWLRSVA